MLVAYLAGSTALDFLNSIHKVSLPRGAYSRGVF